MGLDPVRQFLRPSGLGVSVIGGAKDGDEDLRFTHNPGCASPNRAASSLSGAFDRCIATRTVRVVVGLP
jgi:hypothetical protein